MKRSSLLDLCDSLFWNNITSAWKAWPQCVPLWGAHDLGAERRSTTVKLRAQNASAPLRVTGRELRTGLRRTSTVLYVFDDGGSRDAADDVTASRLAVATVMAARPATSVIGVVGGLVAAITRRYDDKHLVTIELATLSSTPSRRRARPALGTAWSTLQNPPCPPAHGLLGGPHAQRQRAACRFPTDALRR